METIKKKKEIVHNLVKEIAEISPSDENIETQMVLDDLRGHYILFSVGWENQEREYNSFLHIDVKEDGKIWLQHDGTNLKVALLLVEKGISKNDIVLGFHAPYRRELIPDFAIS